MLSVQDILLKNQFRYYIGIIPNITWSLICPVCFFNLRFQNGRYLFIQVLVSQCPHCPTNLLLAYDNLNL